MGDNNYCGAKPPDDLRTRISQACIQMAGHETPHRTWDLRWPNTTTPEQTGDTRP